ncbi:MAG: hypothetical protein B7Z80_27175 [Rhodospirillales bacterium 20-64-7]|nr:MAG: hypothetical protein B7Z80_27175 [Rhodospirillales bacterium 20-64-7]
MTWVDGVAIGIVVLSALFSLVRGFVREMLGVFAWLGAIYVALKSYDLVQPYVASVLPGIIALRAGPFSRAGVWGGARWVYFMSGLYWAFDVCNAE